MEDSADELVASGSAPWSPLSTQKRKAPPIRPGREALVSVMQTADLWKCHDLPGTGRPPFTFS